MNEEHETKIMELMDNLLKRLDFDVKNQPPQQLPHIASALGYLYGMKTGMINGDERHMVELALIKNINNQIKKHSEGGSDGGNKNRSDLES